MASGIRRYRTLLTVLLTSALCLLASLATAVTAGAAVKRGTHRICRPPKQAKSHTHRCAKPSRAHRRGHKRRRPRDGGETRVNVHAQAEASSRRRLHSHSHGHSTDTRRAPTPRAPQAQSNAALIASVLAARCQNTELTPNPGNPRIVAAAALCLVNQERARNAELPLRPSALLEEAAVEHSQEMVTQDYFAHIAPSGLTPLQRVQATGYVPSSHDGYTIGENIAWGTLELSTPKAIVAAWLASPEHLANILENDYQDTAIGVAPAAPAALANGQQGAVYTQEFGVVTR
jgi:uncharacterized protein YkwD